MKEIKKIAKRGVVFLLVSSFVYSVCMIALFFIKINSIPLIYRVCEGINLKGGNTLQKFRDFNFNHKYDVIVLGSSHAYRGYDPSIFRKNGIDLFNLGTSAQTMVNSYFIARQYIRKESCKMVILDVFDGALIAGEFESTSDLVANISSGYAAMKLALHLKDPRGFNMLTVRWLNAGRDNYYLDTSYVENGYSSNNKRVTAKLNYKFYQDKSVSETQIAYLEYTIQHLLSENIPVVLINHPLPSYWDFEGHKPYHNCVSEIAKKYNLKFYDFAALKIVHPQDDFYDAHHLNQHGVTLFNEYILQNIPDFREIKNE